MSDENTSDDAGELLLRVRTLIQQSKEVRATAWQLVEESKQACEAAKAAANKDLLKRSTANE